MNAPGTRRWASSPVDTRRHLLPVDDGPRPIGCLVAVCGHVMPASALPGAEPATAATVCGTCEPAQHGLDSLVEGSGPQSWGDRADRRKHG